MMPSYGFNHGAGYPYAYAGLFEGFVNTVMISPLFQMSCVLRAITCMWFSWTRKAKNESAKNWASCGGVSGSSIARPL